MDFFKRHISWFAASATAALLAGGYFFAIAPPPTFPAGNIIVIARGASVSDIAEELSDAHIIAHPDLLRFVLRISGTGGSVQAGAYRFQAPQNLFTVAARLITGAYGLPPVRLTFPEGMTVREMASKIADAFPEVKAEDFLKEAQPYEGYLFPDTYLFPPSFDAAYVVALMRANFNTRTAAIRNRQASSSLSDIVILASLIEKEARTTAVRRMIAGILWNRLRLGMPLQVDAVFGYIFDRDTYSPSLADLEVDSPYNTYAHTGLPPGPICNPGLESIQAALHPAKTDYLYYLTDKNGVMHYSTTYAGHQANRKKYLN